MPPVSPVSTVPPVYTPPTPEQVSRAANTRLNTAQVENPALTVAAQAQPPLGVQPPQVFNTPPQPTTDVLQQSIAQRSAEVQEAALLRDESIQSLQDRLDPVTTPQDQLDALEAARLNNGVDTAQQLTEFNEAQVQLDALDVAQNQLNNIQNQNEALAENDGLQDQVQQTQDDLQAAQEARAEEAQIAEDREAERIAEDRDAARIQEQQEAERAETQRLQQERDAAEIVAQQDAARAEQVRVQAREQAEEIQASRDAERVVAREQTQATEAARQERAAERAQDAREAQEARIQTDRAVTERALDAYRTQSERAAETLAAQEQAAQPLNDQLQAARARLDAIADTNIDRVDISNSALVGLAG